MALVASVFAALAVLPLAPNLAESLRQAVCQITNGECGYARPVVQCTTATRDRTVGAAVTIAAVKVGHDDKFTVTELGDGTAEVTLHDSYEAGVQATGGVKVDLAAISQELKAKGYAEGSISAVGGYQTVYKFPSAEAANAWVDRNRSVLSQIGNAVMGPSGDALEQGVNWVKRQTGLGNQDDARAPDAVVVDLGTQAMGGAGYGASTLAGVSGEAKGAVKGSLKINADGTQQFTGAFEAEGSGTGSLAFVSGKLGFTGTASYAVTYDADGNPTELTLTGEYGNSGGLGSLKAGVPVGGDRTITYGANGDRGSKTNHSYTLNLKNPANRAAFDQAFARAGSFTIPRPPSSYVPGTLVPDPAALAGQFAPLVDRVGKDAVYVRAEYDTSTTGGTGGVAVPAFGVDGTYKGSSATLTRAQSQDFGVPSSVLAPMAGCGR